MLSTFWFQNDVNLHHYTLSKRDVNPAAAAGPRAVSSDAAAVTSAAPVSNTHGAASIHEAVTLVGIHTAVTCASIPVSAPLSKRDANLPAATQQQANKIPRVA